MTSLHFMCVMWGANFFIPSYDAWLREQDGAGAYRWHRMFLQHIQVDYSKQRWLLKSPGHLPFIQAIVDEYPNGKIVQTHRDPMRVIASLSRTAWLWCMTSVTNCCFSSAGLSVAVVVG